MTAEVVSFPHRHRSVIWRENAQALREASEWMERWGARGLAARYRREAARIERDAEACEAAAAGRDA
jgi:hypothetical protein